MYLGGLNDVFTDEAQATGDAGLTQTAQGYDWGASGAGSVPVPSVDAPTSNVDWTKLVSTALTTWGSFQTAKLQADTAVKTAPYRIYSTYPGGGYAYPAGAPLVGAAPLSGSSLLILGALAVAAFIFLKG